MSNERVEQVLAFITKYLAPALPVLVMLAVLWGVFIYTVRSEIQSSISGISGDIGTMKVQLSGLETGVAKTNDKIDSLLKDALDRSFPKPTATKAEIKNGLTQTSDLLQLAKAQNIKLDSALISDYGEKVTNFSNVRDPDVAKVAWQVLGSVLDYGSYVNAQAVPLPVSSQILSSPTLWLMQVQFRQRANTRDHYETLASTKQVPIAEAARYENIGESMNGNKISGPDVIIIDGRNNTNQFQLDGHLLKNIIFRNADISYQGGPTILDNVYFINCKFEVPHVPKGQMFVRTVLSHAPANFEQS